MSEHERFMRGFNFLLPLFCLVCTESFSQVNVTTQHNNLSRTGWNQQESILTTTNVNNQQFGKLFSRKVDDEIANQPLVCVVKTGSSTRNVVFVATTRNSVYAFDADSAQLSDPLWKTTVTYDPDGAHRYRVVTRLDVIDSCGAGNNIGISSTPVIDSSRGVIYIVSRSVSNDGTEYVQTLHALDITSGLEMPGSPKVIEATVEGTEGTTTHVISFDAKTQNQRCALLLHNGVVYIAWAALCDLGLYHGWFMGYDAVSLTQKYVYNDTRDGESGGIWMSGQAPSVDEEGNIYLTTGNGSTGSATDPNDPGTRSESLLKLSTASGNLEVTDFFTPNNYSYLNRYDLDYGVDGVMLIPDTHLTISGSKESYLYLLNRDNLGKMDPAEGSVIQKVDFNVLQSGNQNYLHGSPVYFKNSGGSEYIYAWAEAGYLKQIPFSRSKLQFDTLNEKIGLTQIPNIGKGGMLSVSSNGNSPNSGILWATHYLFNGSGSKVALGLLQAFDANDVTKEIWNSNMVALRDRVGNLSRFAAPTIANGKVYVSTYADSLLVYGLNPKSATRCLNPLPAGWSHIDLGVVGAQGDACFDLKTATISAAGNSISNQIDAGHYLYRTADGDYTLTGKIVSVSKTSDNAEGGIMIRSNLDPGSPQIFIGATASGNMVLRTRSGQNLAVDTIIKQKMPLPFWVRIATKKNLYYESFSKDGITWQTVDSSVRSSGVSAFAGFSAASEVDRQITQVSLDSVSFLQTDTLFHFNDTSFVGSNVRNQFALINWKFHMPKGDYSFELERADSGKVFEKIATVPAGLTDDYEVKDLQPHNGVNTYRLRILLSDSTKYLSNGLQLIFNITNCDIYPVPARNTLYINNNIRFTDGAPVRYSILEPGGKELMSGFIPSNSLRVLELDISPLRVSGVYFLKLTNLHGGTQSQKILVRK